MNDTTVDASAYGDRYADIYDSLYSGTLDTDASVERLFLLAEGRPVLELGVGTGRLAIPLIQRGLEVTGIESSRAMLDKLSAKAGGNEVVIIEGDFSDIQTDEKYALVVVAFNTLFCLQTQEAQIRCFECVKRVLASGGVFVVECFVPRPEHFQNLNNTEARFVTKDLVVLSVGHHEPEKQRALMQMIFLANGVINLYPFELRYAWPSELDLMARIAGLRLRHRWGGWLEEPFTAKSERHISIYEHAEPNLRER